ncbi:isopentenyl-diphosphate Delta-isomerase [Nocardioides dongkuii]|uniref:isopentenyl-diphosphate Delta-isomerase n=1 Tax=Nocardioides dongkuii TaxID=2760089 RepID=UPI0015FA1BCE|nr:isopentenyl-diphosphate Delta-isomerase [Nocardioides dongkuii]
MSLQSEERTDDLVVLLDADGTPSGTAPRADVHTRDTPLHLAFSCHLLDPDGRMLMTRRALSKRTWPGVWTNSFCGHPRPGEEMADAVVRYGRHELGVEVTGVRLLLPDFRYRAVDAGGIVENELCPVFVARTVQVPQPNPDEVAELSWADPEDVWTIVRRAPWALSPWFVDQARALRNADSLPG